MSLTIIAIGKKHENWIADGLERYLKRLRRPFNVEWSLIPHSVKSGLAADQDESQRIEQRLTPDSFVVLLDERGELLSSPSLAQQLLTPLEAGRSVKLIIGGAYGVSDDLRRRANLVWSLSPLVFPHQLVRLILVEQLYRAQSIARGEPYHHE